MNTTQLECFLALADCLNFSRAAEKLRITQPAVSHQLKTLEDELGVQLFLRNSKKVRLTQEGHMFLQYAGQILKLSNLSKAQVKLCFEARPLRLGIGCRSAADLQLMRPALEQLRREDPRVIPIPRLIPFSALDNLLAEGEVQVILTFREAAPQNSVYRELMRCPVVCVCRQDHPLAKAEQVTLDQIRCAGPIVTCRPPLCPASIFAIQGQLITSKPPEEVLFCDTQEVLFTLVETGYALSVMPQFPQLVNPGIRYIPVEGLPPLSFGVAYRRNSRSPALRRFLSLLETTVARLGPGEEVLPPASIQALPE